MIQHLALALSFAFLIPPPSAEAKVFRNSYVSFELPDKWDCALQQTEWVCVANTPEAIGRAIIILTAKEVGPNDNLAAYEQHLRLQRTIPTRNGQMLQSKILKVEHRTIANQEWVDGMHESSEVQEFFTRYLATTKERIAILVTFSAHKTKYAEFSTDFIRAIDSLRVTATKSQLGANGSANGGAGAGSETLGRSTFVGLGDNEQPADEGAAGTGEAGAQTKKMLGLALLIAAVGIFLLIRRNRGKKR